MRRLRFLIPIVILALIVFLSVRQYTKQKAARDVYTGTIEAEQSLVGSTVGGRVSQTLAQEGQAVRKGDKIVVFESEQLQASLQVAVAARQQAVARLNDLLAGPRPEEIARARAAAEQARQRLAEAQAGPRRQEVERARAAYNAARSERILAQQSFARTERLYNQGAVAAQTLDEARTRLQTARAREQVAQEQLSELQAGTRVEEIRAARAAYDQARASLAELQAGTRPEQIAQARAALRQADATVQQIKANVRERAVFAPRAGQLQTLNVQVGDIVQPGLTVATIVDPRDLYIKIYVPGGELGGLKVGDKLPVVTDSGVRVNGVVEQIPVEAEFTPRNVQTKEERALQVYAVRIRVPNPDMKIRAGMSADVRLK